MKLTDKQWQSIEQYISSNAEKFSKRGRPSLDKREVLNAILWVLVNGAKWKQIPDGFPLYQTCRNYFYDWLKAGIIEKVFKILADELAREEIIVEGVGFSEIKKRDLCALARRIATYQQMSHQPVIRKKFLEKHSADVRTSLV